MKIRRPLHSEMEEVVIAEDDQSGLHAVIAIHNTLLGPAVCGARIRYYDDEREAIKDATHTAPQTTRCAALGNIPFGGAAAAIFKRRDMSPDESHALFASFARLIDTFDGHLIATEDLGCSMEDIDIIKQHTPFACGGTSADPGDPAYFTALGVLRAIEACARHTWKTDSLRGIKIGVLGIGRVGFQLCEMLHHAGAELLVSDIQPEQVGRAREELGAKVMRPREILSHDCDILSPCAIGSLLDDQTIPKLKCKVIAGSSNNQLVRPNRHARMLHQREIVYAPDFAVNAGALYTYACELEGHSQAHSTILVNGIFDTMERILNHASEENKPTYDIAMRMVREKLRRVSAQRITRFL